MSLLTSEHRSDLNVFGCVKVVLDRLLAGETDDHALQRDAWKQEHGEAIRIRRAEKRSPHPGTKAEKRERLRVAMGR